MIILHIGVQSDPIHKYIIFTDPTTTTPDQAVQLLIQHIDTFAVAHNGEFTFFRDGLKNPLHYQGFSCSQEQRFQDKVVGDIK